MWLDMENEVRSMTHTKATGFDSVDEIFNKVHLTDEALDVIFQCSRFFMLLGKDL